MKELWKKFLGIFFGQFWLVFTIMLVISCLDLIGLTAKSPIGLGFIVAFLYFLVWVIWQMTKKSETPKV